MIDLNNKNVEQLLNEWKERLGLQDWVITLSYNCGFEDLELDDACGETNWEDVIKTATIKIVSEKEFGNDRITDYDFEQILVHELLHIKFGLLSFTQQSYEGKVMAEVRHQLIDDLARAFVMAKRGETKRQAAKTCKLVKDINEPEETIEVASIGDATISTVTDEQRYSNYK